MIRFGSLLLLPGKAKEPQSFTQVPYQAWPFISLFSVSPNESLCIHSVSCGPAESRWELWSPRSTHYRIIHHLIYNQAPFKKKKHIRLYRWCIREMFSFYLLQDVYTKYSTWSWIRTWFRKWSVCLSCTGRGDNWQNLNIVYTLDNSIMLRSSWQSSG